MPSARKIWKLKREAAAEAVTRLRDNGYLMSGDIVLVTQGDLMGTVGSTNTCRILEVE